MQLQHNNNQINIKNKLIKLQNENNEINKIKIKSQNHKIVKSLLLELIHFDKNHWLLIKNQITTRFKNVFIVTFTWS